MLYQVLLLLSRGIRKRAWAKNLLVFFPVILDGQLLVSNWYQFLQLFICFSIFASAVYIFNDSVDTDLDRHHPLKQDRIQVKIKFAKSEVVISILILLFIFSVLLIPIFSLEILTCFIAYLILNIFYSLRLKQVKWADIVCLAFFLFLRIVCGFVLISQWPSWSVLIGAWLALFGLASIKRILEIHYFLSRGLNPFHLGRPYDSSTLIYKAAAFSTTSILSED